MFDHQLRAIDNLYMYRHGDASGNSSSSRWWVWWATEEEQWAQTATTNQLYLRPAAALLNKAQQNSMKTDDWPRHKRNCNSLCTCEKGCEQSLEYVYCQSSETYFVRQHNTVWMWRSSHSNSTTFERFQQIRNSSNFFMYLSSNLNLRSTRLAPHVYTHWPSEQQIRIA